MELRIYRKPVLKVFRFEMTNIKFLYWWKTKFQCFSTKV